MFIGHSEKREAKSPFWNNVICMTRALLMFAGSLYMSKLNQF